MSEQGTATSEATKKAKEAKLGKGVRQLNLIDALPTALLVSIIALLPISSMYACRFVCKLFRRLIEEHFSKLWITGSPYTTVVFKNDVGVQLLELGKGGYCKAYKSIFPRCTKIVGSCNGLLCSVILNNYYDERASSNEAHNLWTTRLVQVCNPILGQYVTLPKAKITFWMKDVFGFGVSSRTRSYKVLRISTRRDPPHLIYKKKSDAEIVTIGTDHYTWRCLKHLPYPSNQEILAAIVEGSFHWLFDNEMQNITSLQAFNIEEERPYQIPIPPNIKNCNVMRVGVLQDCLSIFDNSVPGKFSIWSMKEYGVMESWTLQFNLNTSIPGGLESLDASVICPVAVLRDESIFIKSQNGNFYTYDQKNKKFAKFESDNMEVLGELNGHIVHSPNFCPADILATRCLKFQDSLNDALWIQRRSDY
ncbi:hypothetical protein POM88_047232 [Heracleum sosnowskyi]|uniref:F-box domain-containing protein n=1 Tax=Heracleum sosnowskyi TaxID=360622 RepID=A0AAD8GSV2_9APIA|nr:hypothetical protein POM88_047232 [Heracleum sosnowskyi]